MKPPIFSQADVDRDNKAWGEVVFYRNTQIGPIKKLGVEIHKLFKQVCEDSPDYLHPFSEKERVYYTGPNDPKKQARFALFDATTAMYKSLLAFENQHYYKKNFFTGKVEGPDEVAGQLLIDTSASVLNLTRQMRKEHPDQEKIKKEIENLHQLSKQIYPHSLELFDNIRRFMTFCTIAARLVLGVASRAVLGQRNEFSRGIEQGTNKLYDGLGTDYTKRNLRDSIDSVLKEAEKLAPSSTETKKNESEENEGPKFTGS